MRRWRQMKIQRQVGDRWWPALQAMNHWRVSHMLISFAFGNYLTDNSMEDESEETATGQENHLKGYCNNPGQKWWGTKPKQWQWECKWGARVKERGNRRVRVCLGTARHVFRCQRITDEILGVIEWRVHQVGGSIPQETRMEMTEPEIQIVADVFPIYVRGNF